MKVSEVIRAIEQAGCVPMRQRGSHRTYQAPNGRLFTVVYHSPTAEMPPWHVQRQLKPAGLDHLVNRRTPRGIATARDLLKARRSMETIPQAKAPATLAKSCPKCKGSQPLYVRTVRAGATAQVYGMPHYFAVATMAGYCARCRGHYPI